VNGGARTLTSLPANGAISVIGADLEISGTLKGNVTVGADGGDIIITDDLRYLNNDPDSIPPSTDMLQLVASEDIEIGTMDQDDLEIDAYMVALGDSFEFDDYNSVSKGTLTVYGGIMQNYRGAVGVVSGDHGYEKNYRYDKRLATKAPLYSMPLTDSDGRIVYAKKLWWG
jgi:hypothetical protein